jgi:hypothetical protein
MTKHHAIEIVSASILAGILSISAVRLEAVPSMAAPQSATPFSRFVQAGYYYPPACPQDYHYACRPGVPNNGYRKYCACWPTWPDWLYSPYGPYR